MRRRRKIRVGDHVVCVKPAGVDDNLEPRERPIVGEVYTITKLYAMSYGMGCQLEGLNPAPYRGYLFYVGRKPRNTDMELGWYFQPLPDVDIEKIASRGKKIHA